MALTLLATFSDFKPSGYSTWLVQQVIGFGRAFQGAGDKRDKMECHADKLYRFLGQAVTARQ